MSKPQRNLEKKTHDQRIKSLNFWREFNRLSSPTSEAKDLNLSPNTLAEWRSTGKVIIPYLKIGKIVRYSLTDVNKFLENNRLASTLDKVIDPSSVTDFKHGSAKSNLNEAI